jgi:hypothetical protein
VNITLDIEMTQPGTGGAPTPTPNKSESAAPNS